MLEKMNKDSVYSYAGLTHPLSLFRVKMASLEGPVDELASP